MDPTQQAGWIGAHASPAGIAPQTVAVEQVRTEIERSAARDLVRYSFFALDRSWLRLPAERREAERAEALALLEEWSSRLLTRTYSLVGTRADADLMLWQAAREPDALHAFSAALRRTPLGASLQPTHVFLGVTRPSIYQNRFETENEQRFGGPQRVAALRVSVAPAGAKYVFVYPFVKTREWYMLPQGERQRMMDEHISAARAFPDIRLNTAHSYGIDDQEFIMAFESDTIGRFVDLVMALRLTEASRFTLRDTPCFTCVGGTPHDCLAALG